MQPAAHRRAVYVDPGAVRKGVERWTRTFLLCIGRALNAQTAHARSALPDLNRIERFVDEAIVLAQ
jgi:hypothetical protein